MVCTQCAVSISAVIVMVRVITVTPATVTPTTMMTSEMRGVFRISAMTVAGFSLGA